MNRKKVSLKKIKIYLELTVGLFLAAVVFNLFFFPMKIVVGGNSGIAIIVEHLFNVDPSMVILIYALITLMIGFFVLGYEVVRNSIYGALIFPLFINLTSGINEFIIIDYDNALALFIIGAVIIGVALGLVYKTGYTLGGTDIIKLVIRKYFGYTIGKASLVVNGVIVIIGGIIFGWTNAMYALLILYISAVVIDKVLLGIAQNKAFYIVTKKDEELKKHIINDLNRGVSVIKAKNNNTNETKKVLMCIIPKKEYYLLKEIIKKTDKEAFYSVVDAYEVSGGYKAI